MTTDISRITDIHSHGTPAADAVTSVRFPAEPLPAGNYPLSVGIHPWDTAGITSDAVPELIASLSQTLDDPRIVAIGETGLDTLRGAPIALQKQLLLEHIRLSEQKHLPLIIHAVRTIHEILALKSQLKPVQNWAIHGFRGKPQLMAQLHHAGIYTSLHPSVIPDLTFPGIDPTMILTETDTLPALGKSHLPSCINIPGNILRFLSKRNEVGKQV